MSSTIDATLDEESAGPLDVVLTAIRVSVLLKFAIAGVLLIALGAWLQSGIWAALFPIWGAGLVIVGLGGFLLVWLGRR